MLLSAKNTGAAEGKVLRVSLAWLQTVVARLKSCQQAAQVMKLEQSQVSWLILVLFQVYPPQ